MDSTNALHTALEHGALPWPILAILLLGMFGVLALAVAKLGNLKTYLNEPPFPTHAATVVAGIVAFLGFGLIAMCRMALGMEMPEGYGDFLILLGAVIGVTGAWGVGKRATDERYVEAKERGKSSTPGVNVEGNATVEMPVPRPPAPSRSTDQHPVPVVVTVPPKGPAFGGKSR
jgi:hypothetical protein